MAIAIRGTPTTTSATNGGNMTLNMPTGVAQGDVVYVGASWSTAVAGAGGTSSSGWTQLGATLDNTMRLEMWRKVMGASPDASIVLLGNGGAAESSSAIAMAFSGVSTGLPEDGVARTTATGSSTNPNCPSITPTTTGDIAIAFAGTRIIDTTGTGAPSGYSDFTQQSSNDNNDTTSYMSWKSGLTGGVAEDPAAYSGVSSAAWGAFTVVVKPAIVIAASAGSYAFTGTATTLKHSDLIGAGAGSYAFTGTAATLKLGTKVSAAAGSYAFTGTAATLKLGRLVSAGAGSYAFTGTAATLRFNHPITASAGSYAFTGTAATLNLGHLASAAAGSYAFTGTAATLKLGRLIAASAGSYAFTGTAATLTYVPVSGSAFTIAADAGTYNFTGTAATLTYTPLAAEPERNTGGLWLSPAQIRKYRRDIHEAEEEIKKRKAKLAARAKALEETIAEAYAKATGKEVKKELVAVAESQPIPTNPADMAELARRVAAVLLPVQDDSTQRLVARLERKIQEVIQLIENERMQHLIDDEDATVMLLLL